MYDLFCVQNSRRNAGKQQHQHAEGLFTNCASKRHLLIVFVRVSVLRFIRSSNHEYNSDLADDNRLQKDELMGIGWNVGAVGRSGARCPYLFMNGRGMDKMDMLFCLRI